MMRLFSDIVQSKSAVENILQPPIFSARGVVFIGACCFSHDKSKKVRTSINTIVARQLLPTLASLLHLPVLSNYLPLLS